jgi:hypothetical protein
MKSSTIAAVFVIVSAFAVGCAGPRTNMQASSPYTATDVVAGSSSESAPLTAHESHAERRPAERAHH